MGRGYGVLAALAALGSFELRQAADLVMAELRRGPRSCQQLAMIIAPELVPQVVSYLIDAGMIELTAAVVDPLPLPLPPVEVALPSPLALMGKPRGTA